MNDTLKKMRRGGPMTCVRMTEDEKALIEVDSVNTGKSIPQLLKERYFSEGRQVTLITKPDLAALRAEIMRLGNNVNQIARRLNSGIRSGFNDEIKDVREQLDNIWAFLASRYCRCKPLSGV